MASRTLSVTAARKRLNLSQAGLADALNVAPLTVRRWEKVEKESVSKGKRGKQPRAKGRPAQIPPFLEYALHYLLLKAGKKKDPTEVRMMLPDSVGAALPMFARDRELFLDQDLIVDITPCETGTEALEMVHRRHAHFAGAAKGLLDNYRETIIDLGMVMWSPRAFTVIPFDPKWKRGVLDEFQNSLILYPRGSDLERLLFGLKSFFADGQGPQLRAVEGDEAVEIGVGKQKQNTLYVAWEPLASRIKLRIEKQLKVKLDSHPLAIKALERALSYEFHIACSRSWCEDNPAAAFAFMCALSQAELQFRQNSISYMNDLWQRYGVPRRSEDEWSSEIAGQMAHSEEYSNTDGLNPVPRLQRYVIAYRPSTEVLRLLGKDRIAVVERTEFDES